MSWRTILGMLICCATAVSCVPMQPQYPDVRLPPERIHPKGYSLVPLNETGWVILNRSKDELVLRKSGEGKNVDESYVIHGSLLALPAYMDSSNLVRIVKERQAKDVDPQRFRLITHDVSYHQEKGADCARAYALADDT